MAARRVLRRRRGDRVTPLAIDWSGVKLAMAIVAREASWRRLKLSRRRKEAIIMAYVLATGGRLSTDLDKLLDAMRAQIGRGEVADQRAAIAWSLRRSKRQEALLARRLWAQSPPSLICS